MSISKDQVAHIASLARLKLSETQTQAYTNQLNDILHFAAKLNELNTDGIEPTSHALSMTNVVREDIVRPSLTTEEALLNAPEQQEGMFRVPAVFQD